MTPDPTILRTKDVQERVFRVACDPLRYGLTLKVIAMDSGIPDATLRSYAGGAAVMPVSALVRLCGVLPEELLSLLLPDGFALVRAARDGDHDGFAGRCIDFAAELARAHHPESEDGVQIGPREADALRSKRAGFVPADDRAKA